MKPATEMLDLSPPATAAASRADRVPSRMVDFYELTKPRMNFLVVITTMMGYLLVSKRGISIDWLLLFHTLMGTTLCAASAAVLNQVIERDIDAKMPRTRNRPIPAGRISRAEAATFGIAIGIAGVTQLATMVNLLTAGLGLVTIVWYLTIYTPLKRYTTLNTVIGAVPGAIPSMMGCAAAQGGFSIAAIALFAILFFWQMPHFLAIAVIYRDDYRKGGLKMLPSVETDDRMPITARMTVLWSIALIPVTLLPVLLSIAGTAYFSVAFLLGLAFLSFAISCALSGYARHDARKLFFASIIYLPLLLSAMMLDKV